jgi:hypothetical protein
MAVLATSGLILPRNIADGMVKSVLTGSAVAALSARSPQRFGSVDIIQFTTRPRAEFVDEGANKSSSSVGMSTVTAVPRKAQVTMRFNEEVQWADDDYQLGVLNTVAEEGSLALARALDLGLFHRVNPLTGTVLAGWTNYLNSTTKRVEQATATTDADIQTAVGLVVNAAFPVNGLALDPTYAFNLATTPINATTDTRPRYPELGFGADITNFRGIPTKVTSTVSGTPESAVAAVNNVKAIVGDFASGIYWGVQRDFPVEMIRYGDPDGQGDLKRTNQIALRLEIVYGWYVFPARFAVVENQV